MGHHKIKWKRKNNSGQTMSQCGRFWFVTLNAWDAEVDGSEAGEVRLWHDDTNTLVGHFASASDAKWAAQAHMDDIRDEAIRERNERLVADQDKPRFRACSSTAGYIEIGDWTFYVEHNEVAPRFVDGWLTDEPYDDDRVNPYEGPVDEFTIDGARIVGTRPLTQTEVDNEIWPATTVALELENGIILFASRDGEGNGPGALFGQYKDGGCFRLGVSAVPNALGDKIRESDRK